MDTYLMHLIACCTLFFATHFVWASGVLVTLSPSEQLVIHGQAPHFVVKVKALDAPIRIIKFSNRGDLKDNYVEIRVTRNGKDVQVPIAISDPGPFDNTDYDRLSTGQSISFTYTGEPLSLNRLPPGKYKATIKVQPDWKDNGVKSNTVTFNVIPK